MYEPYLHREKQYLKMNADLDNRYKEIDQMKTDSSDTVKPRLNVFGNGSKVNQSPAKPVIHIPKQKRNDTKCGISIKPLTEIPNASHIVTLPCERVNLGKITDKPLKLMASARSNQKDQSLDYEDKNSSTVSNKASEKTSNTTVASPNDTVARKNISSDGLIKFLKSKVAILKQELELSQQENAKNIHSYESSIESYKKQATKMDLVIKESEVLKIQFDKLQKTNELNETVIKDKDTDFAKLNKEISVLRKDLKEVNRLHSNLEKRFLKSQDDLEHAKKNLNNSQECERQQRSVNHQQKTFFEDQIKIMSKQRAGLISAYKKQLLLLDNLKRQNLCLEQSKLIQIAENDFTKVLDWNN